MEEELIEKDEASLEREQQRSESEARDIIHDVNRLYTFPEERKTRWVWELLQNAKDVADENGVDITFKLEHDKLIFSHNGLPFKTKHLLALLYKTSTKSLNGEGGTTGKYGTGFVTTHLLNKKLTITGVHENDIGKRNFFLEIDRSSAIFDESIAIKEMQESLRNTFSNISAIAKIPKEEISGNWHSFTYLLNKDTYQYAEKGLQELENNLAFTILINSKIANTEGDKNFKEIKSVTIETTTQSKTYTVNDEPTSIKDVRFISLGENTGVIYHQSGKLFFGTPAKKENGSFTILPIVQQAILYKEFPLMGTENFNLPVFIQNKDFLPTELRDGIRTKKSSEEEPDPIAEKNRTALKEFVEAYLPFIQNLIDAGLPNLHLFARSGLPANVTTYSNLEWYQPDIQKPIRDFILEKKIVKTCAGEPAKISDCIFPTIDLFQNAEFYQLASTLLPTKLPDQSSVWQWCSIIQQESDLWPENIGINVEKLLSQVPAILEPVVAKEESINWLKSLYKYLDHNKLTHLGNTYPIYLNEANHFCIGDKVKNYPAIDPEFMKVAKGLGRPLEEEFLNKKLDSLSWINQFDLPEFYNHLNKELISELKIEAATPEKIKAIFHVCCLFRSERAVRRDNWYKLINELLPELAPKKIQVVVDYENYGRSAEFWSIKYVCNLIEKSNRPSQFTVSYFQGNTDVCFNWMQSFLEFIFSLKEETSDTFLKRRIIPTQSDEFMPYDEHIFSEGNDKRFTKEIKDIYKDRTGKGDPRRFIIDERISFDELRTKDVSILTNEIDKVFQDANIEARVKKGADLNQMFVELNSWFEQFSNIDNPLPTFSSKRASLYILALGEGFSKQIMDLNKTGKSMDDLFELAKIKLTPEEMKILDNAAAELGANELLAKAQDMLDAKRQIDRWKKIGDAAEVAFKEAIEDSDFDYEIKNPDRGKDFELIINAQGYAIEIKSVDANKPAVRMSILQGRTAVKEKDMYALCVMPRPDDESKIDKEYFKSSSRFVMDIGYQIGDKIANWDLGLNSLEVNDDIKVSLIDKTETVYVNKNIWREGISFDAFITELKKIITKINAD